MIHDIFLLAIIIEIVFGFENITFRAQNNIWLAYLTLCSKCN